MLPRHRYTEGQMAVIGSDERAALVRQALARAGLSRNGFASYATSISRGSYDPADPSDVQRAGDAVADAWTPHRGLRSASASALIAPNLRTLCEVLDHDLNRLEDLDAAMVKLRADHEVRAELGDLGGPRRLDSDHGSSLGIDVTRLRWSWELEPRGVFKLMTPLVARMGRRQEETIWANLEDFLEGQATPQPQT